MIYISDIAQSHFAKLLANREKGTQIRVFVTNPGTINAEIGISYCPCNAVEETDLIFKFKQLIAYVDEISAPYLKDAEIDYIIDNFNSQLTIKAPNLKVCKVPGNKSLVERIAYILQSEINPQLANHNGHVTLIEITKEGYAVLQFSGGCNGCSMANLTLKNGIEKRLLREFPELNGVYDLTEHKRGKHSYC